MSLARPVTDCGLQRLPHHPSSYAPNNAVTRHTGCWLQYKNNDNVVHGDLFLAGVCGLWRRTTYWMKTQVLFSIRVYFRIRILFAQTLRVCALLCSLSGTFPGTRPTISVVWVEPAATQRRPRYDFTITKVRFDSRVLLMVDTHSRSQSNLKRITIYIHTLKICIYFQSCRWHTFT